MNWFLYDRERFYETIKNFPSCFQIKLMEEIQILMCGYCIELASK